MQHCAPLALRIAGSVHLEPLHREDFVALIDHGLKVAGSREKLLTDSALEILWRATHGIPRAIARLLRTSLRAAHRMNQNLVDDHAMTAAIDELTPHQKEKP